MTLEYLYTVPVVSIDLGQTDNFQLSSNTVMVAGVAVSVGVLVLGASSLFFFLNTSSVQHSVYKGEAT